ncbi:Crp/Fnr family transcriptional regulator [Rhodocyclus purpureus]|uniref:Crp/Fnr family transcriptional regulator n=1 Tax=Rhodocyclus purpureus TaxID=1067 RepID=UPI0019132D3D|nr:Crp/Fnr family transcriptional regulator [Rhodocyclus purpureus]MBK5915743.1 Crp/Fnr family transcriptional regulator [Rhodocyclus purpureus]
MHGHRPAINIEALLAHVPLFKGLSPEEISRLARGTRDLSVLRGELLFNKGDIPTGMHLVVYGQVKLAFTSPQGGEKVVEILGQGETFGEAVMFMDKPYIVHAQALCDSLLLHVSKSAILDEMDKDPGLARKMIAGLSLRLHQVISDVESFSLQSARQRIIGYLLRDVADDATETATITLPTQKGVIASRLNVTHEHFSRILQELSQQGLLKVDGRRIDIANVAALRRYEG